MATNSPEQDNNDLLTIPFSDEKKGTMSEKRASEKKERRAGWRVLTVLFFALAAGGLFLGLLFEKVGVLRPVIRADGMLTGSLLGYIYESFRTLFSGMPLMGGAGIRGMVVFFVEIFLLLFICFSVVLSLVLSVVCFFGSAKNATRCAMTSGVFVFLGYGSLFAWNYSLNAFREEMFRSVMFDMPTAIVAGAALLALIVAAFIRRKGGAILNLLLFLLTVAAAFGFLYPSTLTVDAAGNMLRTTSGDLFLGASVALFLFLVGVNLIISTVRLSAKKCYAFDCIRFGALLLSTILVFVAFILAGTGAGRWAIFTEQLFPTVCLLCAAFGAFLLSLLIAIVKSARRNREEVKQWQLAQAAAESREAAPAPLPEPEERPALPEPNTEEPITEFERTMEAIARGEAPERDRYTPPPAPAYTPITRAPIQFDYGNAQYTYDPFINSLTPQEKNEFGDIFIAGKYGDLNYLPAYVIGGDNGEFFSKVFIYLGRFRKNISPELLDKLYSYVSKK